MLVPVLSVRDLPEAVRFLTQVLDFKLASASPEVATFYAVLTREQYELHLNLMSEHRGPGGASVIVTCDDVDALFTSFRARGLVASRANSPAHEGPLDQTWGTREVYIDDPSGNTLIFQQRQ